MKSTTSLTETLNSKEIDNYKNNNFADFRPADYIYALMCSHIYDEAGLKQNDNLPNTLNWIIKEIRVVADSYFGAIYINYNDKQIVVAHKGMEDICELQREL